MAFDALIPFAIVFATVNREILVVMIKSCRLPGIYAVTGDAIRRESCRNVVGVVGRVVLR